MTDPTPSPAPPAPPAPPGTRTRFVADLVCVAIGVAMIVVDRTVRQPMYPTSVIRSSVDAKYQSFPSYAHWLTAAGAALVIVFGVLAVLHRRPRPRRRRPVPGWCLAVAGIVVGGYLVLSALVASGLIGERAIATTAVTCNEMTGLAWNSNWSMCDVPVRWPDGSTGVVASVPVEEHAQSVVVVRPAFRPWPFPGAPHGYNVCDVLALATVGVVGIGRGAVRGVLLLTAGPPATVDVATNPAG